MATMNRRNRGMLSALSGLLLIGLAAPTAVEARFHHHHGRHLIHHARYAGVGGAGGEYYTNVSGHHVHRPIRAASAPVGASARCGDGSWSFSEHHQGTCSHHGGVSRWL